ncbi:hypothetical protein [Jannaschia formosa]|uniref:hypothetical protein n=1 Tax=Jannaschia formosa TaxID=2259592 RepID=UPI000E1BCBE5|nr:hypothetical protein [Jannaschia formosa]TFL19252.1 hypothetical protein DR046_04815 [Jannaschia formosa]
MVPGGGVALFDAEGMRLGKTVPPNPEPNFLVVDRSAFAGLADSSFAIAGAAQPGGIFEGDLFEAEGQALGEGRLPDEIQSGAQVASALAAPDGGETMLSCRSFEMDLDPVPGDADPHDGPPVGAPGPDTIRGGPRRSRPAGGRRRRRPAVRRAGWRARPS